MDIAGNLIQLGFSRLEHCLALTDPGLGVLHQRGSAVQLLFPDAELFCALFQLCPAVVQHAAGIPELLRGVAQLVPGFLQVLLIAAADVRCALGRTALGKGRQIRFHIVDQLLVDFAVPFRRGPAHLHKHLGKLPVECFLVEACV